MGCLLAAHATSVAAQSQLLDYGAFAGYGLKKGILGNDYGNPLAACITGAESALPASRHGFHVSIVSSSSEYKQAFHIDQSADASFLGIAGGGDTLHFGQENSGSSSAFDIIVEAYGEHDSATINNVKWDPQYQLLLDSRDPAKVHQVREACGDRYIQTVFNEVRLFAVMHVSRQQTSTLTTFSGSAHGKVDLDIVSASASLGGDANVSAAHRSGAISIDIYTEGFSDPTVATATAVGIGTADGIEAVATRLGAFLGALHEAGQPVKYKLTNYPLLPTGDLTDIQIVDQLNDLKGKYFVTYGRLGNLKALTAPFDSRRSLFVQPAADTALKRQVDAVTAYLNAVAKAHAGCRQALTIETCTADASVAGMPPSGAAVELPPIFPPLPGAYIFAIDGDPVPLGQAGLLMMLSSGPTLLDAARKVKAGATEVDLVVPILGGDYLSSIDLTGYAPQQVNVAGRQLLWRDLGWPANWKDPVRPGKALSLVHADAEHPCKFSRGSDGLRALDETCLTGVGQALRDVAVAATAQDAALPAGAYFFGLWGATTNCFGQQAPVLIATLTVTVRPSGSDVAARASVFLVPPGMGPFGPGPFLPTLALLDKEESHDAQTWKQRAVAPPAFVPAEAGPAGANPCMAHIR